MKNASRRRQKRTGTQRAVRLGGLLIVVLATVTAGQRLLFDADGAQQGAAGEQMVANALSSDAPTAPRIAARSPDALSPGASSIARADNEKDENSETEAPSTLPVQLVALDNAQPQGAGVAARERQATEVRPSRDESLLDETLDGSALRFAIGDRIRVTVFERVDKGADRPLYLARADMSGEILVEADGSAPMPFIGALAAFDRTPSQLAAAIKRRAQALLGSNPRVTLSILSRQPVFVGGDAINARAVDYMPGLLLTQAVTLAGGAKLNSDRLWQQIDLAREEERLRAAERNLSLLSAKLTVLRAEEAAAQRAKDGGAVATPTLETASRDTEFRYDLDRAQRLRALERAEIAQQKEATEAEIGSLDEELAHLRNHVKELEEVLAEKTAKTKEAELLLGRGLTTKASINTLESQLRLTQVRYSEVRATILRAQTQRQQLSHRLLQFVLQERAQRERETAEAEIAVRQAESTIVALAKLIDQARLRESSQGNAKVSGGGDVTYLIARRMPDGVEEMPADLYTALQPGDVVRVEYGPGLIVKASADMIGAAEAEPAPAAERPH